VRHYCFAIPNNKKNGIDQILEAKSVVSANFAQKHSGIAPESVKFAPDF
jgi:hypothetical protein